MTEPSDAIVVSMKADKSYESCLLVFKGSNGPAVQQQIAGFFGLAASGTPYETFLEGEALAKGAEAVRAGLGGRVSASESQSGTHTSNPVAKPTEGPSGAASKASASEPELTPEQELILKIAGAVSKRDIASLFAENKELWKNPEVAKAAKMKAEALA